MARLERWYGEWDAVTAYPLGAGVSLAGAYYIALTLTLNESPDVTPASWFPASAAGGSTAADVTFTPAGSIAATDVQAAIVELDSEKQPLDADLTAIAALTSAANKAPYATGAGAWALADLSAAGRALIDDADAAAQRTTLGLGTAATQASTAFDAAGAAAAAQAASQPLDGDLTAIAALAPANDDVIQRKAGAWTNRTLAQLIADLAALGTTFQPLDSDLTSIAALTTTSFGRALLELADAAALRTAAGLGTLATLSAIASAQITDDSIVNADINSAAAIALTKLAAIADQRILGNVSGGSAAAIALTPAQLRTALGMDYPVHRAGFYYEPQFAAGGNLVLVQNVLYAMPFYVPVTHTYDRASVVSTGVASSSVRLGVYNDGGGFPGTLLTDFGSVATTASALATITISQALTGGTWYWLACAVQGANGNVYSSGSNSNTHGMAGVTAPFTSGAVNGFSQTGISGTLPSPWGSTLTEQSRLPVVWIRA